jgi:hypothetical protein
MHDSFVNRENGCFGSSRCFAAMNDLAMGPAHSRAHPPLSDEFTASIPWEIRPKQRAHEKMLPAYRQTSFIFRVKFPSQAIEDTN